jgi:hypothetical protein
LEQRLLPTGTGVVVQCLTQSDAHSESDDEGDADDDPVPREATPAPSALAALAALARLSVVLLRHGS